MAENASSDGKNNAYVVKTTFLHLYLIYAQLLGFHRPRLKVVGEINHGQCAQNTVRDPARQALKINNRPEY